MKSNKIYSIASISLVIGLVVFFIGFSMLDFDIKNLSTVGKYEEKSFISSEIINSISIEDKDADVQLLASTDNNVHITYDENDRYGYKISEDSGELNVTKIDKEIWYKQFFTIEFEKPSLKIEIPQNFAGDISIITNDGNIDVENVTANNMYLKTSACNIDLQDALLTGSLEVKDSDGKILVTNTTIAEDMLCHTSAGKIDLNVVEAKNITLEDTDASIFMTSVKSQEYISANTNCGGIELDNVEFNTELSCVTSDGGVQGTVTGSISDYSFTCKAIDGTCNLPTSLNGGEKEINIKTSCGDIELDFAN